MIKYWKGRYMHPYTPGDEMNLRHYLRVRGRLDTVLAVKIVRDAARIVGILHAHGRVHSHLGLSSVRIRNTTDSVQVVGVRDTSSTPGIIFYCPPERSNNAYSAATDVYALGCLLYELLTGHAPFLGETPTEVALQHLILTPAPPSSLNPAIPPTLDAIILRCLEKAPGNRFQDGAELARVLDDYEPR
jgi:serine/threonine protein kinase